MPDHLPAAPFVDHILWTSVDVSIWVGLSLWIGCMILISPLVFLPKTKRSTVHYTFVVCWLTLIAAAAMGAYPTPLVGYGASAIIGYFVSIIFLQPIEQSRSKGDIVSTCHANGDKDRLLFRKHRPNLIIAR
ncbi:MAG: hypothetical protein ABJO01_12505 [Parasphingorhabdus sp.]|uniref:hypothetical protein n=1 Tax=Parasphingorhabdus sp. TaxID=2709688 RepID=UPI00329980A9